mgnify:CR=1 FL=1
MTKRTSEERNTSFEAAEPESLGRATASDTESPPGNAASTTSMPAEAETPPPPPPPPPTPVSEPSPAELEIIRLRDALIRLQADFENLKKRHQREREQWIVMAEESLVRDLIPILDHFEFGIRNAEAEPGGLRYAEGLRMILTEFHECLRRHGVEIVHAEGQPFDPEIHEAVAYMPSDRPEGVNLTQTAPGYRMGGRLLRPARVVVSSGPSGSPAESEQPRE